MDMSQTGVELAAAAAACKEDTWLRLHPPKMKKQVTFAEGQTVYRLHQDDAFQRSIGMKESRMAARLKTQRPNVKRCEPQLHDVKTVQIPQTMTAGPFLKHTALTPAQKEYLYTIAASYSTAHVRDLINQHYMNVLHRCIPTGHDPERDDLVVPSSVNLPGTEGRSKHPSGVFSPTKHKEKIQTGARNPGKSSLSNTPSRQTRSYNTAASKQTKMEKNTSA
uniref:Protein FAM216A-like n=1 Tax=Labrus bergylta TaxID=56723 RepID=A0A3Q3EJ41_9LABR|nr:protein FAM216A-like [Labrus bergylta]